MSMGAFVGGVYDGYMQAQENDRRNIIAEKERLATKEMQRQLEENEIARKFESDLLSNGGLDSIGVATDKSVTKYATPGATFAKESDAMAAANADTALAEKAVASNRPAYLPEGATYTPNATKVEAVDTTVRSTPTFSSVRNDVLASLPQKYAGLGMERAQKVVDQVFAHKQGQLFQKAIANGDLDSLVGSIAQAPEGYEVRSGPRPIMETFRDPATGKIGERQVGEQFGIGFFNPKTGKWHGGAPRVFDSKEHALAEFGTSFSQNPKDYTDYWLRMAEMMRKRDATDQTLAMRAEAARMHDQTQRELAALRAEARSGGAGGGSKSSGGGRSGGSKPDNGLSISDVQKTMPEGAQYGVADVLEWNDKLLANNPALAGSPSGTSTALRLAHQMASGMKSGSQVATAMLDPVTGMWRVGVQDPLTKKPYVVDATEAVNPASYMNPEEIKQQELAWLHQAARQDPGGYTRAAEFSLKPDKMQQANALLKQGMLSPDERRQYQMAFLISQANNGAYKMEPSEEKKAPARSAKKFGGLGVSENSPVFVNGVGLTAQSPGRSTRADEMDAQRLAVFRREQEAKAAQDRARAEQVKAVLATLPTDPVLRQKAIDAGALDAVFGKK